MQAQRVYFRRRERNAGANVPRRTRAMVKGCAILSSGPCAVASDSPAVDLEQAELPALCDGLRRYLQDLPHPLIHTSVYSQMVHVAQGKANTVSPGALGLGVGEEKVFGKEGSVFKNIRV